jgi:hypothetical protein
MTTRRILLSSLLALTFAACSGSASSAPTVAPTTAASAPAAGSSTGTGAGSSAAGDSSGLTGFCATFASDIQSKWPNIDAATASRIGPFFQSWATGTDFSSVQGDMTTVFNWLAVQSVATASATPPPDVATAFDHIKTFAASKC